MNDEYERYLNFIGALGLHQDPWNVPNEDGMQVAVWFYGTLRKGQSNYWLTKRLVELGHLQYRGSGYMPAGIIFDIGGLPVAYRVNNKPGYSAWGECYFASFMAMDILDIFEGNGTYYYKQNVPIIRTTKLNDEPLASHDKHMSFVYFGPTINFGDDGENVMAYCVNKTSDFVERTPRPLDGHIPRLTEGLYLHLENARRNNA